MLFDVSKHCSEPLSVGDFKAKCCSVIGPSNIQCTRKEESLQHTADSLQIDEDTAKELTEICDPKNLKSPLEDSVRIQSCDLKKLPDSVKLKTLSVQKKTKKSYEEVNYIYHMRQDDVSGNIEEPDLEDGTVLLSVMLFHPKKQKKEQGFLVVGSQYLTELKDKIQCITDRILLGERSLHPDISDAYLAKERNKSGFFFIDGVFYNDMRDSYNRDYSKMIVQWAKDNACSEAPGLGSFKSKRMEDTKFEELKIRLGYPYYYCHQGNCEHLLMFTDMRLLHADDPMKLSAYPRKIFKDQPKRTRCSVCDLYTARWMTFDDVFAFEDPSFFCMQCFDLLHYDEKKRKIHNFEAYHYDGSYTCQELLGFGK